MALLLMDGMDSYKPQGQWLDLLGPGLMKANIGVTYDDDCQRWTLTHSHGVKLVITKAFIEDTNLEDVVDLLTQWHNTINKALKLDKIKQPDPEIKQVNELSKAMMDHCLAQGLLPTDKVKVQKIVPNDNIYPGKLFWSDPPDIGWAGINDASPYVDQPLGFHVVDLDGMLVPEEFAQMVAKEEQKLSLHSWYHSKYHKDDLYGSLSKQVSKKQMESMEALAKLVDEEILKKNVHDLISVDSSLLAKPDIPIYKQPLFVKSFKELNEMIKSGQIKLLNPLMKPPKSWFKL